MQKWKGSTESIRKKNRLIDFCSNFEHKNSIQQRQANNKIKVNHRKWANLVHIRLLASLATLRFYFSCFTERGMEQHTELGGEDERNLSKRQQQHTREKFKSQEMYLIAG